MYFFQVAQGASVPSLGLSNKAVEFTGTEVPKKSEKDRHVKDQVKTEPFTFEHETTGVQIIFRGGVKTPFYLHMIKNKSCSFLSIWIPL
jgi:hypothetical protein